jgi:hypothetical protein
MQQQAGMSAQGRQKLWPGLYYTRMCLEIFMKTRINTIKYSHSHVQVLNYGTPEYKTEVTIINMVTVHVSQLHISVNSA